MVKSFADPVIAWMGGVLYYQGGIWYKG